MNHVSLRRLAVTLLTVTSLTLATAASASDLPNVKSDGGRNMQYGPVLCHSVAIGKIKNKNAVGVQDNTIARAMAVALPGNLTVVYDLDRMAVAAITRHDGKTPNSFIDVTKTHHQSYKGGSPAMVSGDVLFSELYKSGWADADGKLIPEDQIKLHGYYLHGDRVVFSYTVAGRTVLELVGGFVSDQGTAMVHRIIKAEAGASDLAIRIGDKASKKIAAASTGLESVSWSPKGKVTLDPQFDPAAFTKPGPPRFGQVVVTEGKLSDDTKSAYVIDELTVPLDNPWGAWMRLSGIDFFADGRAAVATLSGDVWIASFKHDDISRIEWRRFATGLYEPLGLKVVDGKVYVRGRDRITRLHDLNDNGEADYYENFHSAGDIGTSYHAFLFDLVTDPQGNFYFARSGRKAPPPGDVIKLSPDGTKREAIAYHLRHPNGMGYGGPHGWLTIADNPDGKFPSGASIVTPGAKFGENNGPRTVPMLYVTPPDVDTSAGSQVWTDPKRFGPLGDCIIHTSYSKSVVAYVITQNTQQHPNGFAVQMPFKFKAGAMRGAVNPRDGQVYIACQRGWDSNAAIDGAVTRIRYTGKPAYLVTGAEATADGKGVKLTFGVPLDPDTADEEGFAAARIGKGKADVKIDSVKLIDERTVIVNVPGIDPAAVIDERATEKLKGKATVYRVLDPLAITFDLDAKDGELISGTIYCTINGLP